MTSMTATYLSKERENKIHMRKKWWAIIRRKKKCCSFWRCNWSDYRAL
jgi:hypothetical protein